MSKILLTGSSIFEQWSNAADAVPEHQLVNRAIGGTITLYWLKNLADVLAQEKPDVLWFYCGSNDLCADTVPDNVADNVLQCREIARKHNPSMRFAYFSIIKAPQKKGRWEIIDSIHADIRRRLPADDLFVDLNDIFFPNRQPVRELFVEDELHLTEAAYRAIVNFTRPLIQNW